MYQMYKLICFRNPVDAFTAAQFEVIQLDIWLGLLSSLIAYRIVLHSDTTFVLWLYIHDPEHMKPYKVGGNDLKELKSQLDTLS